MMVRNEFKVAADLEEAWALLLDVPAIVPCVPGAELVQDLGNGRYDGVATVKIGPVRLQFRGTAEIVQRDDAHRQAVLVAKGADKQGRGNAEAKSTFCMSAIDGGTKIDIQTDLQLTGAVAQYGRVQGVIQSIAQEIIRQFAANLEKAMTNPGQQIAGTAGQPANEISALSLGVSLLRSKLKRAGKQSRTT